MAVKRPGGGGAGDNGAGERTVPQKYETVLSGGHFGRSGYVKPPRALGERALGGVAAPCSTDRAGGGRAWGCGGRETEPSSARRGPRVPGSPTVTSSRRAGPRNWRVLKSAVVAAARRVG